MDGRTNYYDHLRDARSEARYEDDPETLAEERLRDEVWFGGSGRLDDDHAGMRDA